MEFKHLVLQRYSCREFQHKEVPPELLTDLFALCRFAPSAANFQPWEFLIIDEPPQLHAVYESYGRAWIKSAPVIIIAIANTSVAWVRGDGKNHADIDLAIFIDHLTLAAADNGLATCWVCNFDAQKIKKAFNFPENKVPVALLPLGYPLLKAKPEKKRKAISDFVFYNTFPK